MDIKYDDIKCFIEIHRQGSFTKAGQSLSLSQSALSQKVARLEETLQAALFVRHPRSLTLTSTGERLLAYANDAIKLQQDFLQNFDQFQNELSGVVRIAAYSSIMRSMLIPALSELIRENKNIQVEFTTHEMFELEGILRSNKADFIVTDYAPQMANCEEFQIGEEEYVIIESKDLKPAGNIFLDHTSQDNATESYFRFMDMKLDYKRSFMGDVYSIIDGVALGLGRAVMSKHLVEKDGRFKIKRQKKRYVRPIVLSFVRQNYYGPLHGEVVKKLRML